MRRGARCADLLALAWLAILVFCYLSPALKDGPSFGPADLGRGLSLLTSPAHPAPNHDVVNGDQIDQDIPWNTLDWRIVHDGELPLWNGLSGTGLPELLNFESAVLALPSLVGYLFPLSLAFLVTVAAKLLVAGTGAYVLCRLLGCAPLSATVGATTAMLSGSFAGWLGWAVSGPLAWAGWILAGCVLCYRTRRRAREVALLAVAVAFAVFGGFPEGYALLAVCLGVALAVGAAAAFARRSGPTWRGCARIALGGALGAALGAPLWLAGLPVITASARAGTHAAGGLPLGAGVLLLFQGFYGLPIEGSYWFGPSDYFETAAYVGAVAAVLAVVGVVACWRRPVALGLAVSSLCLLGLVYRLPGAPLQHLAGDLGLGAVALQRGLGLVGFEVGVLAALGAEALGRRWRERAVRGAYLGATFVLLAVVALAWATVGSPAMPPADAPGYARLGEPTTATLRALRRSSLLWPTATTAVLAVIAVVLVAAGRHRRPAHARRPGGAALGTGRALAALGTGRALAALGTGRALAALGMVLVPLQSAFLLFAGVGINSYAAASYPRTPPLAELESLVGGKLVGLDGGNASCPPPAVRSACGVRLWRQVGLYPEINVAYGLDELAMHDPVVPRAYFDAWPVPDAGQDAGGTNLFAPDVDSAALARRYGVAYVLAAHGEAPPPGTVEVASIPAADGDPRHQMTLYAVPGARRFSFAPVGRRGGDAVLSSARRGDAGYRLRLRVARGATLLAHITDVPGWQAFAGGRPLAVRGHDGMLAVAVPAGTRSLELRYRPPRLGLGAAAAAAAVVALFAWGGWALLSGRRRRGAAEEAHRPLVPSVGGRQQHRGRRLRPFGLRPFGLRPGGRRRLRRPVRAADRPAGA